MYPTSLRPALVDYAGDFRAAELGGGEGSVRGADVLGFQSRPMIRCPWSCHCPIASHARARGSNSSSLFIFRSPVYRFVPFADHPRRESQTSQHMLQLFLRSGILP